MINVNYLAGILVVGLMASSSFGMNLQEVHKSVATIEDILESIEINQTHISQGDNVTFRKGRIEELKKELETKLSTFYWDTILSDDRSCLQLLHYALCRASQYISTLGRKTLKGAEHDARESCFLKTLKRAFELVGQDCSEMTECLNYLFQEQDSDISDFLKLSFRKFLGMHSLKSIGNRIAANAPTESEEGDSPASAPRPAPAISPSSASPGESLKKNVPRTRKSLYSPIGSSVGSGRPQIDFEAHFEKFVHMSVDEFISTVNSMDLYQWNRVCRDVRRLIEDLRDLAALEYFLSIKVLNALDRDSRHDALTAIQTICSKVNHRYKPVPQRTVQPQVQHIERPREKTYYEIMMECEAREEAQKKKINLNERKLYN